MDKRDHRSRDPACDTPIEQAEILRAVERTAPEAAAASRPCVDCVEGCFGRRNTSLRLDDEVTCKTCGKKFEIPSQHSLMFVDQLAGLPNEKDLEQEINVAAGEPEPAPEPKPTLPARFTRKPSGWK